jgi:hypothetical protein
MTARLGGIPANGGIKHANDNKKRGTVRILDTSDPRNLDHPSHDEQWHELARAIGRSIGRVQYEQDHRGTH